MMTRGRRRNRITLSGPAKALRNDEIEVEGTDAVVVDDLAARGLITPQQHRAARYLLRDRKARNERYVQALALVQPKFSLHLVALLHENETLEAYGKHIMGFKNPREAEAWALQRLRASLEALADVYRGRGAKEFPGYGTAEELDLEDTEA
jgi:hypothetical protein